MSSHMTMHHQDQAPPLKRPGRRRRELGSESKTCSHCGRSFKRTEHLERHLRTHTKEKPFICRCGAAFTRRDLLTRHQRIALHDDGAADSPTPTEVGPESTTPSAHSLNQQSGVAETPGLSSLAPDHASIHDITLGQWGHQVQPAHQVHQQVQHQPAPGMYGPSHLEPEQYQEPILPNQFFDSSGLGVGFDAHFREFANFLDGVGLPAEWSPYFNGPDDNLDPGLRDDEAEDGRSPEEGDSEPKSTGRAGTPFSSWLPSAPSRNRVPQHLPESSPRALDPDVQPYRVTDEQRTRLVASIETFRDLLDINFKFPSRHALTRHVTSFFEGFHSHMPFIHVPTWRISEHSPELVLAISAIGSQYCFEHRNSERLFYAGKTILLERLRHRCDRFGPKTRSYLGLPHQRPVSQGLAVSRDWGSWDTIETVRALVLLMGYATWEPKVSLLQEAFTLQGLLAQVLRDIGLSETNEEADVPFDQHIPPQAAWQSWVDRESTRRAKLIAFSFLHTHSLAYNVYPVLRSNEVNLRLPCSTREWKAQTPQLWLDARRDTPKEQLYFQDALSMLLKKADGGSSALDPLPTPLANYLLLHGLLQRIYIVRDLSLPVMDPSAALPAEEVDKLESGLRSWTSGWQQAPESSLDPNNESGPIPFTSSSLLGLAYARIYLHLGPYRQLETRDPISIAKAISASPNVDRSDGVISALLYSIHMLSIPVRLGVDRVARSQAFFWSVRHSLAGLECAVLLSKWLFSLARSVGAVPLTDSEDRIVHWVWCIVDEAYAVVDFEEEFDDDAVTTVERQPAKLGLAVLMIWAYFFKSNTQWPFINILGRGLQEYREILLRGDLPR